MSDIYKQIERFAMIERNEALKNQAKKRKTVNVDPESYIAKEIKYQTALIHGIAERLEKLEKKIIGIEQQSQIEDSVNEILRQQLQLLAERSGICDGSELAEISEAMCTIVCYLDSSSEPREHKS